MLDDKGADRFMIPNQMNIGASPSPFFTPWGLGRPIKAGGPLSLLQRCPIVTEQPAVCSPDRVSLPGAARQVNH
jgi:hypothetical protein